MRLSLIVASLVLLGLTLGCSSGGGSTADAQSEIKQSMSTGGATPSSTLPKPAGMGGGGAQQAAPGGKFRPAH